MFTTGSKLLLGATALAVVSATVVGITTGGGRGWVATIGLIGAALAFAVIAAVNVYVRDSNVRGSQPGATTESAAAARPAGASIWPLVSAVGLTLLAVGLVTQPIVFRVGLVVLFAVLAEWMVQAWSERASDDPVYNAGVRKRILHPIEFPVLGALLLGVVIYSFSRIMLFLSKAGGPVAFGIVATLVLVGGMLFATRPALSRTVSVGVCVVALLGLVSAGAVTAIDGEREIHAHETIGHDASVCEEPGETEIDHNASQSLAAKSSLAATIYLEDGVLSALEGSHTERRTSIELPRSTPSLVLFENHDDEPARLTARLGTFEVTDDAGAVTKQPVITCTTLVEPGGRQLLALTIPKSYMPGRPAASLTPYEFVVPGLDGTSIEIVVP